MKKNVWLRRGLEAGRRIQQQEEGKAVVVL
jgi:hypothetical protein